MNEKSIIDIMNVSYAIFCVSTSFDMVAYSYYLFGLYQKGIGLEELVSNLHNKYLYIDKGLQNKEFNDGSGLELYDYGVYVLKGKFTCIA